MSNLTKTVQARVTSRMYADLVERAKRDRRSLSDTIRLLLEDALDAYNAAEDQQGES